MRVSEDLVMQTCLLAGEIMLKNGGETYRVEDTMRLIAKAAKMENVHSFVTPTSIIFSYRGEHQDYTRMIRIPQRTTDLNKITLVNEVSRQFVAERITLLEANRQLQVIEKQGLIYPRWLQYIAAGLSSGSFAVLLGAEAIDFFPTALSGMLVMISLSYFQQLLHITFFSEFLSALLGAFVAFGCSKLFPALHLDLLIIGTMIPLFPGIALTNALRDLIAGDLVAGMSRGVEGGLTALAVAVAAAIVLSFAR